MRLILVVLLTLSSYILYSQPKVIHVLVALCDNKNQGIVPVPEKIGNGQDPAQNLYWGCAYGVKTFFKKQNDWILLSEIKTPSKGIYERLLFKHRDSMIYLIADAYDGALIKQTTIDFLNFAAGKNEIDIISEEYRVKAGGNSNMICYIGHNGLMDFSLLQYPSAVNSKKREVIILACASKHYFIKPIQKSGANPLLWTTHLMCPEAYTLHSAVDAWIKNESSYQIRENAAKAYHQYQKCGLKAARNLLVTGY